MVVTTDVWGPCFVAEVMDRSVVTLPASVGDDEMAVTMAVETVDVVVLMHGRRPVDVVVRDEGSARLRRLYATGVQTGTGTEGSIPVVTPDTELSALAALMEGVAGRGGRSVDVVPVMVDDDVVGVVRRVNPSRDVNTMGDRWW